MISKIKNRECRYKLALDVANATISKKRRKIKVNPGKPKMVTVAAVAAATPQVSQARIALAAASAPLNQAANQQQGRIQMIALTLDKALKITNPEKLTGAATINELLRLRMQLDR